MRATFVHCPKCKKFFAQICEGEHVCGEDEEEKAPQRIGGVKKPRAKKK